jgi:hypothetical protein
MEKVGMFIVSILRSVGIFYGRWVNYGVIWYISLPRFGLLKNKKNLATLNSLCLAHRRADRSRGK